jgi:uncharacterized cysteine cluster protein YcgN (CxxCxxCC family)
MTVASAPFWKTKTLAEMDDSEWESLCDGCGQCCLHKLEDSDTGAVAVTDVACAFLDIEKCRCVDYANRAVNVPDCVTLSVANLGSLHWMPETCAYRVLSEGRDLADWHPLITGDPDSVHRAGISVRGKAVSELSVSDLEDHVTGWLNANRATLEWRQKEARRQSAAGADKPKGKRKPAQKRKHR